MKVGIKKVIKRNKFLALHNNTYVVFEGNRATKNKPNILLKKCKVHD